MATVRERQLRDLTRLQLELFALEDRAARSVVSAYSATRRALVVRILDWWERGGAPVTPTELRRLAADVSLVHEIDGVLSDLKGGLTSEVEAMVGKAQANALEAAERELRLYMLELGIPMRRLPIDTGSVAAIQAAVDQVPGMLEATKVAIVADLRRGLISGESFSEMVRSVTRLDLADRASAFRRGQTSMELFVRRQVIEANNASRNQLYQDSRAFIPGLRKQAVAVITKETTDCCLRVHGQIRNLDEPYVLVGTPRFADLVMYPPFHWRCRTSSVAYHADFEVGELTTRTMRLAAQEALAA